MRKPYRTETEFGQTTSWTWHIPGVGRLTMWDVSHLTGVRQSEHRKTGHSTIAYTFRPSRRRNALFFGEEFGCPGHMVIDSLRCALELMAFLTLQPGDTDEEYFESYTPAQLEWANSSECENAKLTIMELEERLEGMDGEDRS